QLPGKRMLASARAHDQHPHATSLRDRFGCWRAAAAAHAEKRAAGTRPVRAADRVGGARSGARRARGGAPELARLVDGLLGDRAYEEGTDPEIDRELAFARDVVERLAETT